MLIFGLMKGNMGFLALFRSPTCNNKFSSALLPEPLNELDDEGGYFPLARYQVVVHDGVKLLDRVSTAAPNLCESVTERWRQLQYWG